MCLIAIEVKLARGFVTHRVGRIENGKKLSRQIYHHAFFESILWCLWMNWWKPFSFRPIELEGVPNGIHQLIFWLVALFFASLHTGEKNNYIIWHPSPRFSFIIGRRKINTSKTNDNNITKWNGNHKFQYSLWISVRYERWWKWSNVKVITWVPYFHFTRRVFGTNIRCGSLYSHLY